MLPWYWCWCYICYCLVAKSFHLRRHRMPVVLLLLLSSGTHILQSPSETTTTTTISPSRGIHRLPIGCDLDTTAVTSTHPTPTHHTNEGGSGCVNVGKSTPAGWRNSMHIRSSQSFARWWWWWKWRRSNDHFSSLANSAHAPLRDTD